MSGISQNSVVFQSRPTSANSVPSSLRIHGVKSITNSHQSSTSSHDTFSSNTVSSSDGNTSLWRIIKSQQQQLNRMQTQIDELCALLKSSQKPQALPQLTNFEFSDRYAHIFDPPSAIVPLAIPVSTIRALPVTTPLYQESSDSEELEETISHRLKSLIRKYSAMVQSSLSKFSSLCYHINFNTISDLFIVSSDTAKCSICEASIDTSDHVLLHMYILTPLDKIHVHGIGRTEHAAKENAAFNACTLLESMDSEIFTLRKQRLRLRLEDFGVSVPKSSAMQILQDENDPEKKGDDLPLEFLSLMNCIVIPKDIIPEDGDEDEEEKIEREPINMDEVLILSESLLLAIPRYTLIEVEAIVCRMGLTLCDEISRVCNPFLISSIVSLFLRLDGKKFLTQNEKLTLSFCKIMEQVLLLQADLDERISLALGRLIRAFVNDRCVPFMSKNRLETIAIQLSLGGREYCTYLEKDVAKFPEDDLILLKIVETQSPSPEYLTLLIGEFGKVNTVIRDLFGVDGQIYGSLVNGFPTKTSDIDVVVNLPTTTDEEDHRNLIELTLLYEALLLSLGSEWIVSKIESARVPILICKKGSFEINISFNHQVVIENSALLSEYASFSPKVAQLVVLIKYWAKQRAVNDSLQGTLSSYSYVLLVISFLQANDLLPNLQNIPNAPTVMMDNDKCSVFFLRDFSEKKKYSDNLNNWTLKKLLVRFFEYYLYNFNYVTDIVSIGGWAKKCIEKKLDLFGDNYQLFRRRTWISIADPFEIDRYLGTSARGTELLVKEMIRAVELVMNGEFKDLFKPYSKNDRHRFPPFPLKELNRLDPVGQYRCGQPLSFKIVEDSYVAELRAKVQNDVLFRNLCFLSNKGLPLKHGDQGKSRAPIVSAAPPAPAVPKAPAAFKSATGTAPPKAPAAPKSASGTAPPKAPAAPKARKTATETAPPKAPEAPKASKSAKAPAAPKAPKSATGTVLPKAHSAAPNTATPRDPNVRVPKKAPKVKDFGLVPDPQYVKPLEFNDMRASDPIMEGPAYIQKFLKSPLGPIPAMVHLKAAMDRLDGFCEHEDGFCEHGFRL